MSDTTLVSVTYHYVQAADLPPRKPMPHMEGI